MPSERKNLDAMSYQGESIYEVIKQIDEGRMFLPALQRRFVWGKHQIELLFDSIMRGYPFGTFLFWELSKEKANQDYVFYEFKKSYDEREPFNERKTGAFTTERIIGVLDGQQRISSIYIGLQGTHTEKGYRKRKSSQDAYKSTKLFLNLLSLPYEQDETGNFRQNESANFEFRFLTEEVALSGITRHMQDDSSKREHVFWFPIGQVMRWPDGPDVDHEVDRLIDTCKDPLQAEAVKNAKRMIRHGLSTLYNRIRNDQLIQYFKVSKDDLEDILKIFIRVNSGGTVLTKTDLLFSTIVATWDEGREKIEELQKRINDKGMKFDFGTEYLMRCCLVLTDGPVFYKVHSFKASNVQAIRDQWTDIAKAIETTVDLIADFGFSRDTLASNNATIPIAYYIYKGGKLNLESRINLHKYLIHSLLKQIYGSSQDQLLNQIRNVFRKPDQQDSRYYVLKDEFREFEFSRIADMDLPGGKTLKVTPEDIDRFLEYRKGPATFAILQILSPALRFKDKFFHQDHIHPASGFNRENLTNLGLTHEMQETWIEMRDQLPNLQLMDGVDNQSKNAKPLKRWLELITTDADRELFIQNNFLPEDVSTDFADFERYFTARRIILREKLCAVLAMKQTVAGEVLSEDSVDRLEDEDVEFNVFETHGYDTQL